ncbi:MAG: acetate kinase [bacterium]
MKVLVLNCGSSSVKFQLIETSLQAIEDGTEKILAKGSVEKIGMTNAVVTYDAEGKPPLKEMPTILEHKVAIEKILKVLTDPEIGVIKDKSDIEAVGHRVVHGGEKFSKSEVITKEVLHEIQECNELAPLHNPHNVKGYQIASQLLPDIPHAAVFDTSFHQSMPARAYLYGLPYVLYQRHAIRRYGFHGTSHRYLTFRSEHLLKKKREEFRLITIHLGNGCSMAAVKYGKSVDTTMGFTPLEGLLMGTRTGDLDPAIILHVMAKEEIGLHEANTLLNKHSGLIGISGVSNDMRELFKEAEKGNERAQLAIEIFAYRVKKYIGAYLAVLGGADAIAFTGGIGENAVSIREKACHGIEALGVKLDKTRNAEMVGREGLISTDDSIVKVFVIPTNEELVIARDTVRSIEGEVT